MKRLFTLSALIVLLLSASAQIVINEVIFTPAPAIELKNLGTGTVNVSTLQLCSFPEYDALQDLAVVTGSLMLGPGELLVVAGHTFNISDDEMGLYTNGPFGEPANILDYVEWGSTGHVRSATAVMAGIWTTGDFVNADAGGASIEFDGEGNMSSDWLLNGSNSQGEENSNAGGDCEASAFAVGSQFICEGGSATFQLILTGIGPWTFTYSLDGVLQDPVTTNLSPYPWMLSEAGNYDLMTVEDANCVGEASGSVTLTYIDPPSAALSGEPAICPTETDATLIVSFTGQGPWTFDFAIDGTPQGEVTVANNPTTIPISTIGTYTLTTMSNNSCEGTVTGLIEVLYSVAGGTLSYMDEISAVNVCVDDDFPDPLTFDIADEVGENTDIVITDESGAVTSLPGSNVIDFDGSEAGTCLIWNLSYENGLTGLSVGAVLPDALSGCFELSNPISVIKQTGDDCTVSVQEFEGLQDVRIYPNPVLEALNLSFTLEERKPIRLSIIDMTGKVFFNEIYYSNGGAELAQLDVSSLRSGAYILQMTSTEGSSAQRMFVK
jgi:hypothetical protein